MTQEKRAIEDHFKRIGVKAKVEHTGLWGNVSCDL